MRRLRCAVYLIAGGGAVKVGISDRPGTRLQGLQTASPVPLSLEARVWFPDRSSARSAEAAIHRDMSAHHLRGEWFRDCEAVRGAFANHVHGRGEGIERVDDVVRAHIQARIGGAELGNPVVEQALTDLMLTEHAKGIQVLVAKACGVPDADISGFDTWGDMLACTYGARRALSFVLAHRAEQGSVDGVGCQEPTRRPRRDAPGS